jgi:hypothetical protein
MTSSSTPEPCTGAGSPRIPGEHEHVWRLLDKDPEDGAVREFSCDHCRRVWFN